MRCKHHRLRAYGRWVVWVCTGLLLVAIPVSIWVGPGVRAEFVPESGSSWIRRMADAHCVGASLVGEYYPRYTQMYFSSSEPGWFVASYSSTTHWPIQVSWWRPMVSQGGGSGGAYYRVELPTVYPALLMLGWSFWLVRGRLKPSGVGCCTQCGYSLDGLPSDVCPECGVKDDG